MHLQAIVAFCLSIVQPLLCYDESPGTWGNPILAYLKMDSSHVSEHEIVKIDSPESLHEGELSYQRRVNIRALGMDVNLLLHPTDSKFVTDETPVFYAHYAPNQPNGVHYERVVNAMKGVGQLFEDPAHSASMTLGSDQFGRTTINGHLRSRQDYTPLVIRSLPQHIVDGYLRNRRSIESLSNDSANSTYHFVAKLNEDFLKNKSISDLYRAMPQRGWNQRNGGYPGHPNTNNQHRPITLRPEVLIQVDATYQHDLSRRGLAQFLEYLLAFWNGVDMVYRNVDYPKFRFNIAGIVIAKHPGATPYIARHMLSGNGFDSDRALDESLNFFFRAQNTFPLDRYDIAVTMTHYQMGKNRDFGVLGIAYEYGVCSVNPQRGLVWGSTLVHDSGAFSGIGTAAHEIGHLFGLHHDDKEASPDCKTGFVMSAFSIPTNQASWFSRCSLESLRRNFDSNRYQCLYNGPPAIGRELPKFIGGRMVSLAEQCAALGHGLPYFPRDRHVDICAEFYCNQKNRPGWWVSAAVGAAPGTPCGSENDVAPKICLKNRCVELSK